MARRRRQNILRPYLTERYKRLWYPVRPMISMTIAGIVLSLSWFGLLSVFSALMVIMFFTLDDIRHSREKFSALVN
jgi:hypothetical protein